MSRIIKIQELSLQKKLSGYVSLFLFHLGNICVKADPISLLALDIIDPLTGGLLKIEETAQLAKPNDYYFHIYPFDQEFLRPIIKALLKAHPEFKQQYFRREDNTEVKLEDIKRKEVIYIRVTMPVINQEMHDLMCDRAKAREKECALRIDKTYEETLAKLPAQLKGCDEEDIEECKEMLKKNYDLHVDKKDEMLAAKLKEIDEAYQNYDQNRNTSDDAEQQRKAESHQTAITMRYNPDEEE